MSSQNFRTPVPRVRNTVSSQTHVVNHAGAVVPVASAKQTLVRMTLANLLWEDSFYMDGKDTANILAETVHKVDPEFVSSLALAAREKFKLRHVPLLLTRELARTGKLRADTLTSVIQRPDEMGEFLSIYWKDGRKPLANQVKKGLANAFSKFNEYQLAKWDKNSASVSLRDVMFLTHPKPANLAQESLFKRIADQTLETPDTWETQLSAGADKKETFARLMEEKKLGALAFLRNLRNMVNAGIPLEAIEAYGDSLNVDRVLPFRYIAAYRVVPALGNMLQRMMFRSLEKAEKLPGKTVLLVDVSGSMDAPISQKSDLMRIDAASALAMLCREICEEVEVYTFSNQLVPVSNVYRGFELSKAILRSQNHAGTNLAGSLRELGNRNAKRLIVFTDEQANSAISAPNADAGYIVNVAAYQHGLNHGSWTTVTGFSESVIEFIRASEQADSLF